MGIIKKRGVSNVVSIVLIILLVVSSITILWMVILPLIKNLELSEPRADVYIDSSGGYTFYDAKRRIASVNIKHGGGDTDLEGIQVIFSVEGNSEVYVLEKEYIPDKNGGEAIAFFFLGFRFGDPTNVGIAPIFRIGDKIKIGGIVSNIKIPKASMRIIPEFILYKYWCDGGDQNENGILDFPDEAFSVLPTFNLDCRYEDPGVCCPISNKFCCNSNKWCNGADITRDGFVNDIDLAVLLTKWGNDKCSADNSWCNNADVNHDKIVDEYDLGDYGPLLKKAICVP